ncbi:15417_t:CDS:2, partial [Funneliformis geosporum]
GNKRKRIIEESIRKDLNKMIKTATDIKQLIKKGLIPESYIYEIPKPGKQFEYIIVENESSERMGDKMEYPEVVRRLINYDDSYQLSSEIVLETLKKLKDSNKALIAGRSPLALGVIGVLSTGSPPAIDQPSSHVPSRIISVPVATPASILPISAAALPWNSLTVFNSPI